MADWPELTELKQKLDVTTDDWDDHLDRLLAAAIAQVQIDVGEDVDDPDESLAHAALVLAVGIGTMGDESSVPAAARLPAYQRLLKGHRVRFGVA
jgi:hypothetical protein